MKHLYTPTELRQEVERQIGRPLSERHWTLLLDLADLRSRADDERLAPLRGPDLRRPADDDDLAALLKLVTRLKGAVSAIWKQKRSSPGHWAAYCGAGDGCGRRLAEWREEYSEATLEPGYVQDTVKDGVYRRSFKYKDMHGAKQRPRKRVDPETRRRFGYIPEVHTKVRVPLPKSERAYVECYDRTCGAINYVAWGRETSCRPASGVLD